MVSNIGGIESAWRSFGADATSYAFRVLSRAYDGVVLRYAGTVFPGIAAVCSDEFLARHGQRRIEHLVKLVGTREQTDWRRAIMRARSDDPNLKFAKAGAQVFRKAWGEFSRTRPDPAPPSARKTPPPVAQAESEATWTEPKPGSLWCDQCDRLVPSKQAVECGSPFCSLHEVAA